MKGLSETGGSRREYARTRGRNGGEKKRTREGEREGRPLVRTEECKKGQKGTGKLCDEVPGAKGRESSSGTTGKKREVAEGGQSEGGKERGHL